MNQNSVLAKAVEIAGGQTPLARKLSEITGRQYKQSHVWNWLFRGDVLPAEVVLPIEQIVNGKVTRHEMRPDVFGDAA